jgi:hypothetical protein
VLSALDDLELFYNMYSRMRPRRKRFKEKDELGFRGISTEGSL